MINPVHQAPAIQYYEDPEDDELLEEALSIIDDMKLLSAITPVERNVLEDCSNDFQADPKVSIAKAWGLVLDPLMIRGEPGTDAYNLLERFDLSLFSALKDVYFGGEDGDDDIVRDYIFSVV